jgi:hypothetical protein
MSWILKELRNYALRPLDEPQDLMDWLVFGNRAHKPKPQKIIPEVIEKDEVSRAIENIKGEELSKPSKPFIPPAPPLPPSEKPFIPPAPPLPPSEKPFIPPAPPLPPSEKPFIPPAPPLPPSEQLSPVPFKPFIPPAPPLPPSNELTPRPPKNSVVFVEEEPKENPVNDLLRSIREGTTLKPTKKKEPVVEKKSFLDELKEKPKLNKPKIVKQKEPKKEPKKEVLTFNDLIKQNKKFQALSKNVETKNEDDIDYFEGWGRKKRRARRRF